MSFKREELREILGDAATEETITKLVKLHRTVVDPLTDELDTAKRDAAKYKTQADKVPDLQRQLDDFNKGEDWKTKYENEKKAHDEYKAQVARDATTAKAKAAHKKLLIEEGISEKAIDSILSATDYSKAKLKEDGTFDDASRDSLKKDITDKWGGFKVSTRKRGEQVENPIRSGGKMTKEEIMKIKDPIERQGAIAENLDVFQRGE